MLTKFLFKVDDVSKIIENISSGINNNNNANINNIKELDKKEVGISRYYIPTSQDSNVKLFTGNSNTNLANEIAMYLGVQLGRSVIRKYSDGEISVNILDNIRGKEVFVVQSMAPPINESLFELLLIISTLRRASAAKITAIIPYYGYSRTDSGIASSQDSKNSNSSPIPSADIATMLEVVGVDRIITVDLHHPQIQGFFDVRVPVDNIDVSSLAIPFFEARNLKDPVVVSPDANGTVRARSFRDKLIKYGYTSTSLAIIVDNQEKARIFDQEKKKRKSTAEEKEFTNEDIDSVFLVGDVFGRDCIIFDDMIDSGRRIVKATKKLKNKGAKRVFAFTTHGIFSGDSLSRIEESEINEIVCTNSIPLPQNRPEGMINAGNYSQKIHQISIAALLAEVILRIHENKSLSSIFVNPNNNDDKSNSAITTNISKNPNSDDDDDEN